MKGINSKLEVYQNFTQAVSKYAGNIRSKDFYQEYIEKIKSLGISSVTELGMGSGDFLYHLPSSVIGIGIDKSAELVQVANQTRKKPNLSFYCADIGKDKIIQRTELVVMTGFLCTFLDYRVALETALETATKHVFINDFLNEYGVDAKFSFRENGQQEFQTPYNIWSRETLEDYLKNLGVTYEILPYKMTSTLSEQDQPLNNYMATLDGEKVITNKGGILLYGYNIFINKV